LNTVWQIKRQIESNADQRSNGLQWFDSEITIMDLGKAPQNILYRFYLTVPTSVYTDQQSPIIPARRSWSSNEKLYMWICQRETDKSPYSHNGHFDRFSLIIFIKYTKYSVVFLSLSGPDSVQQYTKNNCSHANDILRTAGKWNINKP